MRVAEHEAVARVPQHEGLGDGLDGVAQAKVGLDGLFGEALLLGDVDGNADQVQAAVARALAQFAAHAQPDPVAAGVLHAEGLVDMVDFAGDEPVGDGEQIDVVALHQRVDLAEGEEVAAGLEPEHGEHRMRPEDAAAREVPVPQAAAAAVERGVDAAAHGVVDEIALAGAGRLPVEGEAEDQHDEAGRGRQRHRQRGVRAPDRLQVLLDHDDRPGSALMSCEVAMARLPSGRRRSVIVPCLPGVAKQLCGGDRVENAVGLAGAGFDRDAGEDAVVGRRRRSVPSGRMRPSAGMRSGSDRLQALDVEQAVGARRSDAVDALRRDNRRDAGMSRSAAARFCRLWSSTCTKAPRQMVMRKAMISVGTARRSVGSAVSSLV